jgi:hypothetical protein
MIRDAVISFALFLSPFSLLRPFPLSTATIAYSVSITTLC